MWCSRQLPEVWWYSNIFQGKMLFPILYFWQLASDALWDVCWGDDLQRGTESYCMSWVQSNTKTVENYYLSCFQYESSTSQCILVLYLASRQNFIWSQYCNIILIHYIVVYCQSAAFITKQNKTSGFWYCHLLLAAWTGKTPLLISRSAVCDAAIGHGECKLLPKRQTVIYFSELLYYLRLIKYPGFIMSHLKGSWVLQVCKNLNII